MRCRGGIVVLITGLLLAGAGPVYSAPDEPDVPAASEAESEAADPAEDGSWLTRNLRRYFGNSTPTGDELDGRAVELVGRYTEHVGKPIEVVLISQVARFEGHWDAHQDSGQKLLNRVTKPLQSYTRDSTIRQYVLFEQGQVVDPFLIADTERMLRSLDYIEDVRISLVPLPGEVESVAIVVETRDRWPFGAAGTVKDVGRYEVSLYSSNVGGRGIRFENRVIYRDDREPNLGYQGILKKENIGGSFIRGQLEFEDSYRKLNRLVELDRGLSHPSIKWVGGIAWRRTRERDSGPDPQEYELADTWLGDVIRLKERPEVGETARPVLVPAIRFNRKTFLDRPTVTRDSLRQYHHGQNYLGGLTYQRLKYYKTSYLYEMGETENLPSGLTLKVSGGYQDGEYHDRAQAYFESTLFSARNRGDVLMGTAKFGGLYRSGVFEDGSLILGTGYITRLWGQDTWRSRFYVLVNYHLAINRVSGTVLKLGNSTGLRGMEDNQVEGNQRLLANVEYRVFSPWSVMGFRFMFLGYLDAGTIAAEDEPILQAKVYGSAGLAVRIQNPDLVLPPMQMRVAFLNSINDKGVQVGFRIGSSESPEIRVPGTQPGRFEFR